MAAETLEFFGLDGDPEAAVDDVVPPASLGRWRRADPATIAELERIGGPALTELGYEVALA